MAGGFFALIFLLAILIPGIFFLLTLSNTLKTVSPSNRTIDPWTVWLMLIPVVNLFWPFVLYSKIRDSINFEYKSKGVADTAETTHKIGVVLSIAVLASALYSTFITSQDLVTTILSFIILPSWIVFWVQMSNHKNKLQSLPSTGESMIFDNYDI